MCIFAKYVKYAAIARSL